MLNHYEHQKLAEIKEKEISERADEQWMFEPEFGTAKPKSSILKRIRTALAAASAKRKQMEK